MFMYSKLWSYKIQMLYTRSYNIYKLKESIKSMKHNEKYDSMAS